MTNKNLFLKKSHLPKLLIFQIVLDIRKRGPFDKEFGSGFPKIAFAQCVDILALY